MPGNELADKLAMAGMNNLSPGLQQATEMMRQITKGDKSHQTPLSIPSQRLLHGPLRSIL